VLTLLGAGPMTLLRYRGVTPLEDAKSRLSNERRWNLVTLPVDALPSE
jgi:hypothetical protein